MSSEFPGDLGNFLDFMLVSLPLLRTKSEWGGLRPFDSARRGRAPRDVDGAGGRRGRGAGGGPGGRRGGGRVRGRGGGGAAGARGGGEPGRAAEGAAGASGGSAFRRRERDSEAE